LYGIVQAQAPATAQVFTLPISKAGDMFKLEHSNVTNLALEGLLPGVDYALRPKSGAIVLLKDTVATADGTYDAGAASAVGVFTHSGVEYTLHYLSEHTGLTVIWHRWKPNPASALDFISGEFASAVLAGPVLIDEALPEGPLGRFAVVRQAS
jgi:hypothetical protein